MLPLGIRLRILLRLPLLQTSWNYERMQSLGVLYILYPALRLIYRDGDLVLACQRHLEYFNTHPFMAGPILGTTLALEEERSLHAEGSLDVGEFKGMIMAPFAAMGDAFFWGGLRPFSAALALLLAAAGFWWAPLAFLLIFNLPHGLALIAGLLGGYRHGLGMIERVQRYRLPDLAVRCKEGTALLLGALSAVLVADTLRSAEIVPAWGPCALLPVLLLGGLARLGVSNLILILLMSAALLVFFG